MEQILQTADVIPPGLHGFEVMDASGDSKYIWDKSKPVEVEAARQLFKLLVVDKKYLAFLATGETGVQGDQVREFKPEYERLIFTPPLVGG